MGADHTGDAFVRDIARPWPRLLYQRDSTTSTPKPAVRPAHRKKSGRRSDRSLKGPIRKPANAAARLIENISRGRFAINLVNAWNRPELEKAGIGFAEHDERYAYGREWISVVKPLTGGERVSFTGRHFNIDDYELLPHDQYRARPTIYLGGESEPARDRKSVV